jgi:branched-chain amino acid transport system permease protein
MEELAQYWVSGLALGAIYGLVALGFVVVYRASQVFNFAHGDLLTFGAVLMVWLSSDPLPPLARGATGLGAVCVDGVGLPWGAALLLAMATTGCVAMGLERVVLRPLVGRPVFVAVIVTLFVGFVLRTFTMLLWGNDTMPAVTPWDPMGTITLGRATLDYNAVAAIVAATAAFCVFAVLIRTTRLGVAMRATSSSQETALGLGIPVGRILSVTWFVAGAFAALGGVFLAVRDYSADMNLGFVALRAFPAVILGGLDSPVGAVVAGLLLGVLEVLTAAYVNAALGAMGKSFHTVLPYVLMVAILMIRPYGLFGTRKVERL